ncbi:hypothetical protein V1478_015115 [Vespula squamosa]|uniref:Uncharacterized protein n=1 Tax=Vespula squamosa TaxID=30214 RepID=A0ABD2A4Y0_VESSQ
MISQWSRSQAATMALCNTGLYYRPRRSSTLHSCFKEIKQKEIKKSGPKTTDPGEKLINDVQNLIRTAVAYCPGASCTSYLDSQLLTAMKSAIVAPFAGDNCPLWRSKGIAAWTMDRKFLAFVQQTVVSIVRPRKILERRALTMAQRLSMD